MKMIPLKIINSKSIVTITLILLLSVTSCTEEDFFELKSPPTTEWQSVKDLEFGIAGVYNKYLHKQHFAGKDYDHWTIPILHFGMSDIVREISQNGGYGTNQIYRRAFEERPSWATGLYGPIIYKTILYANNILDFIDSDPFPNASEEERKLNIDRIKGEALFLRGLSYYNALVWYAPAYEIGGSNDSEILTLRLNASKNIEEALDNAPDKTAVIYDQVVKDLQDAKSLLPLQYEPGMHDAYQFGRATKHAAGAILAKVLMHMGRYDEALSELNAVLDDPNLPRGLESDPENVWLNNSGSDPWNSNEVIWYQFYADIEAASSRRNHPIRIWAYFINSNYYDPTQTRNWWVWGLNRETMIRCGMINSEDNSVGETWANDKRSSLFNRFEGYNAEMDQKEARANHRTDSLYGSWYAEFVEFDDPVLISSKYYRVPYRDEVKATKEGVPQNVPIIRTAELYLWRAALKLETGVGGQALDINMIRERSWNSETGGSYVPLSDGQVTWDLIDQEWIKEMSFEGNRITWLQMFRKPINAGDRNEGAINPPYTGFHFPIPLSEVDFYPSNGGE